MKKISDHIVIDADVARSSGLTEHPISSSCRGLLNNVKDEGCDVVFCPKLFEEWKKHSSGYARKWLVSMMSSSRSRLLDNVEQIDDEIDNISITDDLKNIAKKDSHLVSLALHMPAFVASRDDKARRAFVESSNHLDKIKQVVWFNPIKANDFFIKFYKNGEELPEIYYLKQG